MAKGRSSEEGKALNRTEWLILRACHRLGEPALTSQVAREVQHEALCDFRHVHIVLRRLEDRGYLEMMSESPRRLRWSLAVSYRELVKGEIRHFVDRALGPDGERELFYEVLEEVEASGEGGLSGQQRGLLIDLVVAVIERKQLRRGLVEKLGAELKVLDGLPGAAQAVLLIKAAGGYGREGVLRVLEAVSGLQLDGELGGRVEELRGELGGG